jgi:hypothetical protein
MVDARRYGCARPSDDARKKILIGTAAQRCVELQQQKISKARPNEKSRRQRRPAAARFFARLGG